MDDRIVGLDDTLICPMLPFLGMEVPYMPIVGEPVADEAGIGMPMGIDSRGVPGVRIVEWASRK